MTNLNEIYLFHHLSPKFVRYIYKRANEYHKKYLQLFLPNFPSLHLFILMYIADNVYAQRKLNLMRELRSPATIICTLTTLEGKFRVRVLPRILVIRCVQLLIDQEFIADRLVKLYMVEHLLTLLDTKIIKFHRAEIHIGNDRYDMYHSYDGYHFARIIHMQ